MVAFSLIFKTVYLHSFNRSVNKLHNYYDSDEFTKDEDLSNLGIS